MQNTGKHFRNANEVTGKQIAFTEIQINASPEVVRAKFLDFEKWSSWNDVIPKIAVKSGDISKLETKPKLDLTLDFGRKNDPSQAPVNPVVSENNATVFNWGFKLWFFLSAEHVFLFEPINNGKGTRLVHYEAMNGILKSFVMSEKTKANMTNRYNSMNQGLKKLCESSL